MRRTAVGGNAQDDYDASSKQCQERCLAAIIALAPAHEVVEVEEGRKGRRRGAS